MLMKKKINKSPRMTLKFASSGITVHLNAALRMTYFSNACAYEYRVIYIFLCLLKCLRSM